MSMIRTVQHLHDGLFGALERLAGSWFLGLAARLVFSSVLLVFFVNSAMTKLGSGFPGLFVPAVGAYAQILPPIAEAAGYDPSKIALFPWKIVVAAGAYAEFLLPVLLLIGLFTRAVSVGLIGFIAVMSFVDINFHGLDAASVGMVFDRVQDSIIADQRLLWIFPLLYLALKGPGPVSVDGILRKRASD